MVFFAIIYSVAFAGDGTANKPYTVSEAIKVKNTSQEFFVQGYIVGEMRDYSNGKYFFEIAPPFDGTLSYLLADNPSEMDIKKCMPIQSKDNYGDLFENPEYWRKQAIVKGKIKEYFSLPGIKDISYFQITDQQALYNEAAHWNFYEDFDKKKAYTPASSEFTFAGGIYEGDSGNWLFKGATLGDTGKDQKWERAAARIRLTEGATGDAGYIQMEESKNNGIGYVRFWAGNYEEDSSGGALALFVSDDEGVSWSRVAHSQNITRTWKEYEFAVNQPGVLKLRISKDETSSKGINVDKIRISDYYQIISNIENGSAVKSTFSIISVKDGLLLQLLDNAEIKIYSVAGTLIAENRYPSSTVFIPLSKGFYLIKVNEQIEKVFVK